MSKVRCRLISALIFALIGATAEARAEEVPVTVGLSGWAGYAPFVLAHEAGLFGKHGLKVTIVDLPEAERGQALAEGRVQCAGAAGSTWLAWIANGTAARQILSVDRSFGADGLVVRAGVESVRDLKGRTVATSPPGTSPFFFLSWVLAKAGLSPADVTLLPLDPKGAAEAFLAGRGDAAISYEPYLSAVRAKPEAGQVIVSTLDEPVLGDTFGCSTAFLASQPAAAKGMADAFFDALELMTAEPVASFDRIGAATKETGTQFGEVARFLRWQDRAANQVYFESEYPDFARDAGRLMLQTGVIKKAPDLSGLIDLNFLR